MIAFVKTILFVTKLKTFVNYNIEKMENFEEKIYWCNVLKMKVEGLRGWKNQQAINRQIS